jgi:NADH-quinone oxidoreductase subunit D
MSYYVVSDGSSKPYRVRVSVPSFRNIIGIPHLLKGGHLADVPAIYWSLDYWPVEADK